MARFIRGGSLDPQSSHTFSPSGGVLTPEGLTPATSLGDVESLAEHRETVEGPNSIVPENLIRFSIGIEDVADLIADLEQALAGI